MVFQYRQRKGASPGKYLNALDELNLRVKVVGEAQGSPEAIKQFLEAINQGPQHARVVKLDKENRELVEDETQFEIRR